MAVSIEELFARAMASFQGGRPDDAERYFMEILRHSPNHVAALNLLGVLLTHLKRYEEAGSYLQAALNVNSNSNVTFYNYGIVLKALKRPSEAFERFSQALDINSAVAETWNNRGTVLNDLKRYSDAIQDFKKAIALNPNYADAFCNMATSYEKLKRHDDAVAAYDKALSLKPDLAEAWLGRGNVFTELKRHDEALLSYDRALAIRPDFAEAWLCRGDRLSTLGRHDEAFAAYDKALALKPDLAEAWLGRGNAFTELRRHDEAIAAYGRALSLRSDLAEAWLGRGNAFTELRRYDEAFAAYDRAQSLKPDLAEAWLGRGNAFAELRRHDEAFAAYDRALSLKPDLAEAWLGRGKIYGELRRHDEALGAYDRALSLKPDLAEALVGRGNEFAEFKRHDEAFAAYDRALSLKPDLPLLEGTRLHAKMLLCDWSNYDVESQHLIASVRRGVAASAPFPLLSIPASPADQIKCAKLFMADNHPPSRRPLWVGERYKHDKIRIAYVSADFRPHPVSYLIAGLIEGHSKSHFDVVGISLRPEDPSDIGQRMKRAFGKFVDVSGMTDDEIARLMRELEIDIAVDLMGCTHGARTNIFAQRPAPIQVNYLGFAGTMGASYIDYLIADATLISPFQQENFSEKIVYLPNSYMPHDELQRVISDRSADRAEFGLPEGAFVFCCFNNPYKFNPHTFRVWMKILQRVDGSVLWLRNAGATAVGNLKKAAVISGIDPARLIFAKPLSSSADHLARHRLADLFLDTLPFNAHTTASDALWAGLPVLTQIGETFAGRVAASLLHAVGLPELVTSSQMDYENLAVELAVNPKKLAAIKQRLSQNRREQPLFNTQLFTHHIEAAYTAMYERAQMNLPPDHIHVSDES